jgi:hypothetical protein
MQAQSHYTQLQVRCSCHGTVSTASLTSLASLVMAPSALRHLSWHRQHCVTCVTCVTCHGTVSTASLSWHRQHCVVPLTEWPAFYCQQAQALTRLAVVRFVFAQLLFCRRKVDVTNSLHGYNTTSL